MSDPVPDLPAPPTAPGLPGGLDSDGFPIDVSLEPGIPVILLCGFKLPIFRYALKYKLPPLAFPPAIPIPFLSLGLLCSLNNPLDFSIGVPNGGGRKAKVPKDPDNEFD